MVASLGLELEMGTVDKWRIIVWAGRWHKARFRMGAITLHLASVRVWSSDKG